MGRSIRRLLNAEVKPPKPAATDMFLHVLHVAEVGAPGSAPRRKLLKADGVFVVAEIVSHGWTAIVTFHGQGKPGGRIKITKGGKKVVDEAFATDVREGR